MTGRIVATLIAAAGLVSPASAALDGLTVSEIIARHVAARGGDERWRAVERLSMTGTYAAFSLRSEFTLIRARGDRYRLDFSLLDAPAVRARDEHGPWARHVLLLPEPSRVAEDPYRRQLEREAIFPPLLLDHEKRGIAVELLGPGEVDGVTTIDLAVRFADGQEETWHLDADTLLEVAVDSEVYDHTQGTELLRQRAFFSDWREVDGLLLPFQVEWEFGARLESMTVESVEVNPVLDDARFRLVPGLQDARRPSFHTFHD